MVMAAAFAAPARAADTKCVDKKPLNVNDMANHAAPQQAQSATLLFMPGPVRTPEPVLTADLERLRGFSVGLFSPTLGRYSPTQMLLDISQGARVASSLYKPAIVPAPPLILNKPEEGAATFFGWKALTDRAADVPGNVQPGLLGCTLANAGSESLWVGFQGSLSSSAIAPASNGVVHDFAIPPVGQQADQIIDLQKNYSLVTAILPAGGYGFGTIRKLVAAAPDRMIIVVQAPPDPARTRLLTIAVRGIGGDGGIRSASTRRDGLVSATDIAPTILQRLGVKQPTAMQGQPIESAPRMSAAELNEMNDRLALVAGRRGPLARAVISIGGIALILLLGLGRLTGRFDELARLSMRLVALALLWLPALLLVAAWWRPSRANEADLTVVGSILLAFATDRLFKWPRAPWVPVAVVLLFHGIDFAILDSKLTGESLLGSNPVYGARFFGVGNELEAVLSISALIGVGAWLCDRGIKKPALWFAGAGALLAMYLGLGRIGADVGGVVTVAAGFGTAALYVAKMRFTPLRVAGLVAIPILGLLLIAGLDAVSGGESHLTRTFADAQGPGDIFTVIDRRALASVEGAKSDHIWVLVIIAIGLLGWGWLKRNQLMSRLTSEGEDPAERRPYRAALVGGMAATAIGALANDSGPAILLIGTIYLTMGILYLRGRPKTVILVE
jgi:hypothetical protein